MTAGMGTGELTAGSLQTWWRWEAVLHAALSPGCGPRGRMCLAAKWSHASPPLCCGVLRGTHGVKARSGVWEDEGLFQLQVTQGQRRFQTEGEQGTGGPVAAGARRGGVAFSGATTLSRMSPCGNKCGS